jgi:N-acetylglucosaminyldiphosphoundecaprenol N-acetyl-beta-D-mannosaminyltransferase
MMRLQEELMSEQEIYYDSWKEDRDLILEYNQVTLDDATVVNVLGIGVDNLSSTQAIVKVMKLIENGGVHHIILLNPYKIHRIKSNVDLKVISSKSSMQIASGSGVRWAAKMLGSSLKERIPALSFIMDLVRISEIKEYTIFLVGGRPEIAERAFFNIKKSFQKIRIVGRHGGYFSQDREKSVIEAIRKSEPNIILVGMGFPKEDKWIYKIKSEFKNAVFISVGGSIDIISGEIKKAPPFFMKRGLDWFYRIFTRPWRWGRLIRLMFFYLHVIIKGIIS